MELNPFRAPEPLLRLNPSNFVPKNGFPVVKGLSFFYPDPQEDQKYTYIHIYQVYITVVSTILLYHMYGRRFSLFFLFPPPRFTPLGALNPSPYEIQVILSPKTGFQL